PEIEPRSFSFNSPHGACPACHGLGVSMEFDEDLLVPDRNLSIEQGAIAPWSKAGRETTRWYEAILAAVAERYSIPMTTPWSELDEKSRSIILNGIKDSPVTIRYTSRKGRQR